MRILASVLVSLLVGLGAGPSVAAAASWTMQEFWPRWTRVDENRVKVGTSYVYRITREPVLGAGVFSTQVLPYLPPRTTCAGAGVAGYPNVGIDYHAWDSAGYHYLGYLLYYGDCSFELMAVQRPTDTVMIPPIVDDALPWTSGLLSITTVTWRYGADGRLVDPPVTSVRRFHMTIGLDPLFADPVLRIMAWNDDRDCQSDTLWLGRTSPIGDDQTAFDGQGPIKIATGTGVPIGCDLVDHGQFLIWSDPLP
jgi:hypothetical protein